MELSGGAGTSLVRDERTLRSDFLPFSRPSITEGDINAVGDVLRSGWITTGPRNAEFEGAFSQYTGSPGAVALCSGSAGMHLVLHAFGIGPGDEVVTPSLTWVSTANLIVLAGATPVFADVDRDTLLVAPDSIRRCLTPRTKLVIPVHFAGASADLDAIRGLAAEAGIGVIEDAAHAVGTAYKGAPIGRKGTAVFSFHPIKNITTGEGGMVCSDDADLLDRIRRLKFHGLGADAHDRETQGRSPQAEVLEPGYKYNMTDVAAVLGLRQLERVERFNLKRSRLAVRYRLKLKEIDEIFPLADPPYAHTHAWHLFVVRLDVEKARMSRDEFMQGLKKKNIGTGIHFLAVHLQRYYKEKLGFKRGLLPDTEWNSDRICSLPLFPAMTVEDVDGVVEAIKEVLTERK
jgi:UDP-4-amino-4-deoxy-L-arabinose-oxoglutarate aminotransferase